MIRPLLSAVLVATLCVAPALASPQPGPTERPSRSDDSETSGSAEDAKANGSEEKKDEDKKKEKKPFAEVVEGMEEIDGLFTFWRHPETSKVFLELAPDQLDRDYIYSAKIEQATGERGLYGTIMMDEFVFQWRSFGERIQFVQRNLRFRASEGTPGGRALESSFSDSILTSAERASKPHEETGALLIDLAEVFLGSDLHGIRDYLKEAYESGYKMDRDDSGFVMLKSFPLNSEIGTIARFKSEKAEAGSVTIPDVRSLSLRFRYSLVGIPENDYRPRWADARVGYFVDQYIDYDDLGPDVPYRWLINRWNLVKKDPEAPMSEPVEPIVFWLENTIPRQYRPFFEEGVLLWNDAFEKIGFRNAIVVNQMPDDADWDPADIRYNTIRWFLAYDASFAIGPSHTNPYTGQIIDADIGFSDAILRLGARNRYRMGVDPVARIDALEAPTRVFTGRRDPFSASACTYAGELTELASFAVDLLEVRGWSSEQEEEFVRQYTAEVTAHEVGHTLGLRHNFRASTLHGVDDLLDVERTRRIGLASSVMDYNPPIVALEGQPQGDFLPTRVGTYDRWAIDYGYRPIPEASTPEEELPTLRKIAARGTEHRFEFATDEDAGFGPRALDPRVNLYDFTDDPLAWAERELLLVDELRSGFEARLLTEGESWEILRRAYEYSWRSLWRASQVAMKYVGGLEHRRDHVGDPGERLPYEPIPAAEQRRALEFLAEAIWADERYLLSAETLRKLQIERLPDFEWSVWSAERLDYPLHQVAARIQDAVLDDLYHPVKLARLQDAPLVQDPDDRFGLADVMATIRDDIWGELESGRDVSSFRRNLQRRQLDRVIGLALDAPAAVPQDAVALARHDLEILAERIDRTVARVEDPISAAHLRESRARIRRALEAPMWPAAEGGDDRPGRRARSAIGG